MKEFIQELIHEYVNNNLTWHDIQDMLEAKIMEQDRHGLTTDKVIISERNEQEDYWLNLIDSILKGGE